MPIGNPDGASQALANQIAKAMDRHSSRPVYWCGKVKAVDDFGLPIESEFIDGATHSGRWAMMAPQSWARHGRGLLGTGLAQRYQRQPDGRWLKVEG